MIGEHQPLPMPVVFHSNFGPPSGQASSRPVSVLTASRRGPRHCGQARLVYQKPILQGLEWNVPGHEHSSVGLIAGQFGAMPNAAALAEFEYLFDGRDTDLTGGLAQGWTGKNTVNDHAKAVQAVTWLQQNYGDTSYVVFAHPERKGLANPTYVGSGSHGYDIRDFRDFNTQRHRQVFRRMKLLPVPIPRKGPNLFY